MEKIKTSPVKGTNDILPKEMEIRQRAIDIILRTFQNNGFLYVKTPILENLEILTKGDSGDNQKLMFKTVKRGNKLDLTKENLQEKDIVEEGLRYDLTVPLSRLFANNREKLPIPFKAIQIDESFRAENPQKGRDRQFTQCDIDLWGEKDNIAEIEIITTLLSAYKNLQINDLVCKISDRRILNQIILFCGFNEENSNSICVTIDKIDKIGLDRCKEELVSKGFNLSNVDKFINAIEDIKSNGLKALQYYGVSDDVITNINEIIECVSKFIPKDYNIEFDISIVRGQGYYTGTVFEIYKPNSNLRGALGGGGRYDRMLEKFLGMNVPAVGSSIGLVPTLMLVMENNAFASNSIKKIAMIYNENLENLLIIEKKYELMKNYDVSIFKWPKNFNNFVEKLRLNNFDGIYKTDKDEFIWF